MYRAVDFKRMKDGVPAKVVSIEYDPNRTTRIALIHYADGEKSYILRRWNWRLETGPVWDAGGNTSGQLPAAAVDAHWNSGAQLGVDPGKGGQLARGAGVGAQVLSREGEYVLVRLPSGEMRRLLLECRASVGQLSNPDHKNESLGKAGAKRHLGRRPKVRGVAKNPVDHPHGGGEDAHR